MELTRRKLKIDKITYSNRGLEQRMMLVKINLWCIPNIIVFSRVTFNQQFCRWRCFSFCWFGKREFGKLTNGFPVIEGPARSPSPPALPHVLQPAVYYFVPGMIWLSPILYSKCTVFAVNLCYLQVLAMYKNVLS